MLEGLTPPVNPMGSCKVATLAATLSESDKEILLDAVMDSKRWGVKTLMRALSERGISISATPISNHRNQTCVCFR